MMNVKIEQLSSVKKRLSVEVAAEMVDAEIGKAYKKIAQTAKIKGFRPGKVPQAVIEQYYAPQMEQQVLNRLINDSYFKAMVEHRIMAVADPEIVDSVAIERGKPFSYEAEVEVKPDFTAQGYADLNLKKERFELTDAVIDERLEEMRTARAELKESARTVAAQGDTVVMDFEGFINDVPFPGGKGEGFHLELGSGQFIPGFEEQLVGLPIGAEHEIAVTFPENYGKADLAGKPAIFKVKLQSLKEKVAPALDDEFAKGFGLDSMADLREKLTENHRRQETNRIDGDLRERLMATLIERNPIEVPEAMVQSQLDFMQANISRRLKSQGMSLEMMGMNEESFRGMYRETAIKQVQGSLILETIARQDEVRVEPGEIDAQLQKIAEMSNAPIEQVRKYYGNEEAQRGLISQIVEEKVIDKLLASAQIEEVERAALEAAAGKE